MSEHKAPDGWAHVVHDLIEAIGLIVVALIIAQAFTGRMW